MAGILRSLISTAAGMPLGKSIRRYAPGVLGKTLSNIKAGQEYKKPKAELGRRLEQEEQTEAEKYLKKYEEKREEARGRSRKASPYGLPAYLRE